MRTGAPGMEESVLLEYLRDLNQELLERHVTGEICILGGAVMVLAFRSRNSTRDIDALMSPPAEVRQAAEAVAQRRGLPSNWLNDGAKGFLAEKKAIEKQEFLSLSNLRIVHPPPEYILAMKCVAARVGLDAHDKDDAKFLIQRLGLRTPEEVLGIVTAYYHQERIAPKTQYFIQEICDEISLPASD